MIEYFISSSIERIEVVKDDEIFFYVDKKQTILGKYTLSYFNDRNEVFLF
jgi:hypothetical protein